MTADLAPCVAGSSGARVLTMKDKRSIHGEKWPSYMHIIADSKVHGANMGPTWGRQDPGGPHVGHMNLALWDFNLGTSLITLVISMA